MLNSGPGQNDVVRELRRLWHRSERSGSGRIAARPENAVAIIAVATAAVCVPLNPDFTADELHRYFGDLQIAALLTRADMNSVSRDVAHTLGIPVIDWSPRHGKGPGAFNLVGSAARRAIAGELATERQRRVYSVDLGNDVAAEDGPTNARERLSFGL